jgi:hypothetical protein
MLGMRVQRLKGEFSKEKEEQGRYGCIVKLSGGDV